jgi:dCTP deaminase
MILTRKAILRALYLETIEIKPFKESCLGPNSYDATLCKTLYKVNGLMDVKEMTEFEVIEIPESGLTIYPNEFYLGVTNEWTNTPYHVPMYDGRSSVGRCGIRSHQTAGFGDIGFAGHWTLEIDVVIPTVIYPNMPIGQFSFHIPHGDVETYKGKYINEYTENPKPVISNLHTKF